METHLTHLTHSISEFYFFKAVSYYVASACKIQSEWSSEEHCS